MSLYFSILRFELCEHTLQVVERFVLACAHGERAGGKKHRAVSYPPLRMAINDNPRVKGRLVGQRNDVVVVHVPIIGERGEGVKEIWRQEDLEM